MAEKFLNSLKDELTDLPDYYIKLVEENFLKYINYRFDQGDSMTRIVNGFGDMEEIAKKYRFFYRLHQLHGRRRIKGATKLIKEALDNKFLPHQLYGQNKSKMIFKSIFMFILGIVLVVSGAGFLIGNLTNPWGVNLSIVLISVFIFTAGLGSFYYISVIRYKFRNEMLSASMDGCKLDYFGL